MGASLILPVSFVINEPNNLFFSDFLHDLVSLRWSSKMPTKSKARQLLFLFEIVAMTRVDGPKGGHAPSYRRIFIERETGSSDRSR